MPAQRLPVQASLPMDLPPPAPPEQAMRELFYARWVRWHPCKRFEEAVKDPITRQLLELAVAHGALHRLPPAGGRR